MKKLPTRKKIIDALNEIVSSSRLSPVLNVYVHSQTNYLEDYSGLIGTFRGDSAKDDLLAFLMDKSLTHRILKVRGWYVRNIDSRLLAMVDLYLLGSDETFLEYTNIDSEMLELLRKVRFVENT